MKEMVQLVLVGMLLGTVVMVLWKFKVWVMAALLIYVLSMMAANAGYKKITGKNMSFYTRMMGEKAQ